MLGNLSDDEIERFHSMDDETFTRQTAMEDFRQLRSLNAVANAHGQYFQGLVEALENRNFGLLENGFDIEDIRSQASEAFEAINRLRATIAKFCEIGETKIDQTGLVEIPEQDAYHAIDRSREFSAIAKERGK